VPAAVPSLSLKSENCRAAPLPSRDVPPYNRFVPPTSETSVPPELHHTAARWFSLTTLLLVFVHTAPLPGSRGHLSTSLFSQIQFPPPAPLPLSFRVLSSLQLPPLLVHPIFSFDFSFHRWRELPDRGTRFVRTSPALDQTS